MSEQHWRRHDSIVSRPRLLYRVAQAKEREEESRRRHKRRVDAFLDMLIDYYYRDDHINVTWEEVRPLPCTFFFFCANPSPP